MSIYYVSRVLIHKDILYKLPTTIFLCSFFDQSFSYHMVKNWIDLDLWEFGISYIFMSSPDHLVFMKKTEATIENL